MLQKRDGVFQSSLIASLGGVIHGFSSRQAGDMRYEGKNRKRFTSALGLSQSPAFAQQTHGNKVPGDGLVSRDTPVAVVTADCVPVLLVDPVGRVCGAVHAGWKGTLGGIVENTVREMVKIGADMQRIYACIGPHIGLCCYNVPEDRIRLFEDRFGRDEKMASKIDGRWHLDIGWANYRQLIEAGVSPDHIDAPLFCTSCQNDKFFSYRKDTRETYGEMMAVIGFDNNHHYVVETGLKPVSTNMKPKRYSISEIIRGFKTFTARKINDFQNTQGTPFWQSRFYDHIIRNEDQLNRIREYIQNNPIHWDKDRNNSENLYI